MGLATIERAGFAVYARDPPPMGLRARRQAAFVGIAIVVLTIGVFRPTSVVRAAGPTLPIRAAFYYPWFPEAWDQKHINPFTYYTPAPAGYYDSSLASVIDDHIARMQYANISAGIASWWGQGTKTDTRIPLLLNEAHTRNFYWTLYYEPSLDALNTASDLAYINLHYGSDPNFLHVNGKPVLFVYTRAVKSCADVTTWVTINAGLFYLSPQVFGGYLSCPTQPDTWHQYAPTSAEDKQHLLSFSISPGFWLRTDAAPRLIRDPARWHFNVQHMVASGAAWQLITTFNEWGEGTAVEDATEWQSCTGYGVYLDELHKTAGGRANLCGSSPAPMPSRSPAAQSTGAPSPPSRTPGPLAPAIPRGAHTPPAASDLTTVLAWLAFRPWRLLPR